MNLFETILVMMYLREISRKEKACWYIFKVRSVSILRHKNISQNQTVCKWQTDFFEFQEQYSHQKDCFSCKYLRPSISNPVAYVENPLHKYLCRNFIKVWILEARDDWGLSLIRPLESLKFLFEFTASVLIMNF